MASLFKADCPRCNASISGLWVAWGPERQCTGCNAWLRVKNRDAWSSVSAILVVAAIVVMLYRDWVSHWERQLANLLWLILPVLVFLAIFACFARLETTDARLSPPDTPEMLKWRKVSRVTSLGFIVVTLSIWLTIGVLSRAVPETTRAPVSREVALSALRAVRITTFLIRLWAYLYAAWAAIWLTSSIGHHRALKRRDRQAAQQREESSRSG